MGDVKASRADRAMATRQRIVDAAYDMFCEQGYAATTMAAIAERVNLAVQTVYFNFHTKDVLLQAVHEHTVMGPDRLGPPEQAWFKAAVAEPDPLKAVGHVVTGMATILARVAPLHPVWHSVAGEPAGALHRHSEELRRQGMRDLAADVLLPKADHPTIAVDGASDLLFVLLGPRVYRSFVIEVGWTPDAWIAWTSKTLNHDLFG